MELKQRLLMFIQSLGMTVAEFERTAGLSNGYIKNFKGSLGVDKLENLLRAFPSLSYEWLVRGEGEMTKAEVQQTSAGDYSPNVNGSGNSINSTFVSADRFMEELSAQRRLAERTLDLLEKRDAQLDRMLAILEKMQENAVK